MPFDPKPFDPKVIGPEAPPLDAAGDLQLPDCLLELAAQLGDDAQHLAKLYPCGHLNSGHHAPRDESITAVGPSTRPTAFPLAEREGHNAASPAAFHTHIRRTSRRLLRAVALVASLAAFAAGATLWYPRSENDPQPRNLASSPERSTTEVLHITNTADATANEPASPNQQSAISNPQSPPPAAPPPASRETFLHEYSGPELEGIYDLIGDSEDDKISI